jgi:hypothetical protein
MKESGRLDLQEQITWINRRIEEADTYAAEQHELASEAEGRNRNCWQIVVIALTAGGALFGAGAAFMKLLIG